MKVAITGAAGFFGQGLVQTWDAQHAVFPLTRADADLTRAEEVRAALCRVRPDVVIHTAAIPDLDVCEAEPAKAYLVNVHGTRHVVEAAREVGAAVVYISTDAVFDGKKSTPYLESDPTIPPTVYGRTKLRGEQIVQSMPNYWVFRVSLLFGPGKTNFVERGLRRIAAGEDYVVAADQVGSATYTRDAAQKIVEVVEARRYGLYHLANQGQCSRLEIAQRAAELGGLDARKVVGRPSDQMGRRAVRLKYAVMEMAALQRSGFRPPRPWQEALEEYVLKLLPSLRSPQSAAQPSWS